MQEEPTVTFYTRLSIISESKPIVACAVVITICIYTHVRAAMNTKIALIDVCEKDGTKLYLTKCICGSTVLRKWLTYHSQKGSVFKVIYINI